MFAVGLAWTIPHRSRSSEVSRDLLFHALDDSSELVPLTVVAILEFVSAYRSKLLSTAPQPQKIAHLRGSLGQMENGAWRLDPLPVVGILLAAKASSCNVCVTGCIYVTKGTKGARLRKKGSAPRSWLRLCHNLES